MKFDSLDKFGHFTVTTLYDSGLEKFYSLANNKLKSPSTENLRVALQKMTPKQIEIIKQLVLSVLNASIHDFLFAIQERNELEGDIKILVDGKNVSDLSDGLNGELYSSDGWINKFSEFSKNI